MTKPINKPNRISPNNIIVHRTMFEHQMQKQNFFENIVLNQINKNRLKLILHAEKYKF